eukprot:10446580-Prorocentrum_lima.AAC.1
MYVPWLCASVRMCPPGGMFLVAVSVSARFPHAVQCCMAQVALLLGAVVVVGGACQCALCAGHGLAAAAAVRVV